MGGRIQHSLPIMESFDKWIVVEVTLEFQLAVNATNSVSGIYRDGDQWLTSWL